MTYSGFLLRFLVIPMGFLLALTAWETRQSESPTSKLRNRPAWLAIGLHILLAVGYTTPWDNYLVATRVWTYNPHLVSGLVIGWVPVEEYTFFVLETLLAGLWWWFLKRRLSQPTRFRPSGAIRILSLIVAGTIWLGSILTLISGWKPGTYLALILAWAIPAIAPQLAFGADILWQQRRLVALSLLPLFVYLSAIDSLAIASGTWTIQPAQSTGIFIGSLPVEEALFFGVTAALITFGLTLALSEASRARWDALKQRFLNFYTPSFSLKRRSSANPNKAKPRAIITSIPIGSTIRYKVLLVRSWVNEVISCLPSVGRNGSLTPNNDRVDSKKM